MRPLFFRLAAAGLVAGCALGSATCSGREETTTTPPTPPDWENNTSAPLPDSAAMMGADPMDMPETTTQIPLTVALTSVGIINNADAYPLAIKADLKTAPAKLETLEYLSKTYVEIPAAEKNTVNFLIWTPQQKTLSTRCALQRGKCYQVFINKQNHHKLAVAVAPEATH